MGSFLVGLFTVGLVIVSLFMILVILMQKPSTGNAMGDALGGGAVESALGVGSASVLSKLTVKLAIVFFVVCFGLYLAFMSRNAGKMPQASEGLPAIVAAPQAGTATEGELTNLPEKAKVEAPKKAAVDTAVPAK